MNLILLHQWRLEGALDQGGLPTKEDLSQFDEVGPDTRTGNTEVPVEGYVLTPRRSIF